MGVEAIGSGVATTVSSIGRGLTKMSAFGAKLEAPLSTFVKEGPALSFTGFKPMGVSDISMPDLGGVFKSSPQLNAVDAISQSQSILPQVKRLDPLSEVSIVAEANHWLGIEEPKIAFKPLSENAILAKTEVQPQIERVGIGLPKPIIGTFLDAKVTSQPQVESPAQLSEEQEVEEVLAKVMVENPNVKLEEEVLEDERFYLEDEQASDQRKYEIRKAIGKAKIEANRLGLKKITGWLVAKFLPPEHEGNRSQVVKKKGPDGSYQETVEAICSTGELESDTQAEVTFNEIVAQMSPVKKGKHGKHVGNKAVARVFKYHFVKPVAYEVVQKRIVKKVVQVSGQNQAQVVEGSLADYPKLAEVFGS